MSQPEPALQKSVSRGADHAYEHLGPVSVLPLAHRELLPSLACFLVCKLVRMEDTGQVCGAGVGGWGEGSSSHLKHSEDLGSSEANRGGLSGRVA